MFTAVGRTTKLLPEQISVAAVIVSRPPAAETMEQMTRACCVNDDGDHNRLIIEGDL